MNPIIRQARYSDLASLVSLLRVLFNIEKDFCFDESKQKQGLSLLLSHKNSIILVAEIKNQIVGMCTGQVVISTAEGGPGIFVEDVVVMNDWQQKGIGSLLLESIADWGKTMNATRLQLLADKNNDPALKFYKQNGWGRTELICLRKQM